MQVNSFVDNDIFDLAHLDESGDLATRCVAGGQLDAQGANDEKSLVVHLHKVDVKHHTDEGEEYSAGENRCVLREEEHSISQQPHGASVHHHLTDGHLGGTNSELPAKAGVSPAI